MRTSRNAHTRSISELSSSSLSLSESDDGCGCGKLDMGPSHVRLDSMHNYDHHSSQFKASEITYHRIHLQWKLSAEEQIEASSLKIRGGFIESEPMFDSEGTAWALRVAPKGYSKSSKGWIGTCLAGLVEWNRLRYGIIRRRLRAVKWTLRNSRTMRIVGEMVDSASTDDLIISSHDHGNVCWLNTFALASLTDSIGSGRMMKSRSKSASLSSQAWLIECRFELVSIDRIFNSSDEELLMRNPMIGANLTISPLFTCHFGWIVHSNDMCVIDPTSQEACVISPLFNSIRSGTFWRLKMRQHSLRSKSEGMAYADLLCDFTRNLFGPSVGILAQCSVAHPFSGTVKRISGVLHSGMIAPPVTLQFPHYKSMPPTYTSSGSRSLLRMKRQSTVKLCEFTATIKIFGLIKMLDTMDSTGASIDMDEVEILQPCKDEDQSMKSRSDLTTITDIVHSTAATLGSLRGRGKVKHDSRPSYEIKRLAPLTPGKSSGTSGTSGTSSGGSSRVSLSAASDSTDLRAAVEVEFPSMGERTRETMMDLTPPMTHDDEDSDRKHEFLSSSAAPHTTSSDADADGIAALFTSYDEKKNQSDGSMGYDASFEYDSFDAKSKSARSKDRYDHHDHRSHHHHHHHHHHGHHHKSSSYHDTTGGGLSSSVVAAATNSNDIRELDKWFRDEFPHSYWIYLKEFVNRGIDSRQKMSELDEEALIRLFPRMPITDRLLFQRKAEILSCEFDVKHGKQVSLTDAKSMSHSRSRASSGASVSTSHESDRLSSTALSKRKKKTAKLRRIGSGSSIKGGASPSSVASPTVGSIEIAAKKGKLRRPPRLRSDTVSTSASGAAVDRSPSSLGLSDYNSDSIGDIIAMHHPYYQHSSISKAHTSDTPSLTDVD